MTQHQKVMTALQKGLKTIAQVAALTGILRPNIRRILGQGALAGTFKREGRGIYTLTAGTGEKVAYIELSKAEKSLPRLVAELRKFDMVFLDPPYFSQRLIGGNRGIKQYDFIHSGEFADVMHSVSHLLRNDDSHVYMMLSGARGTQRDMQKYIFGAMEAGLQYVGEGQYRKTFKDGSAFTNVLGKDAAPERLILFTKSGSYRSGEIGTFTLDIEAIRPPIKGSYATQKPEPLCDQLILQSTHPGEAILDPFAGSGVMGVRAILLKRIAHMIESLESTIDNFILPKLINAYSSL